MPKDRIADVTMGQGGGFVSENICGMSYFSAREGINLYMHVRYLRETSQVRITHNNQWVTG